MASKYPIGCEVNNLELLSKFTKNKNTYWTCKCFCGTIFTVPCGRIVSGNTKSCGCLKKRTGTKSVFWRGCGEIPQQVFGAIRRSAKKRNIEVTVTLEHLWELYKKQNGRCALSGVEIKFYSRSDKRSEATASLDRICSNKPYEVGNVQWVHKDVNNMKQGLSEEAFLNWCKLIIQTRGSDSV